MKNPLFLKILFVKFGGYDGKYGDRVYHVRSADELAKISANKIRAKLFINLGLRVIAFNRTGIDGI